MSFSLAYSPKLLMHSMLRDPSALVLSTCGGFSNARLLNATIRPGRSQSLLVRPLRSRVRQLRGGALEIVEKKLVRSQADRRVSRPDGRRTDPVRAAAQTD